MSTPDLEELQRRLRTRMAELAAAHQRIEEMREKIADLRETKAKLKTVRAERDVFKNSAEYRLGHKIIGPFKKLFRKKSARPAASTADAANATKGAASVLDKTAPRMSYHQWRLTQLPTEERLREMAVEARQINPAPLISILMPVYNTPESMLIEAVESVRAQVYENWQLIAVNDASPEPYIRPLLDKLAAADPRIVVSHLDANIGIALASNAAFQLSTGDFVALLDHDDWIEPDALFEIARAITTNPEADFIYSDEDKIDEAGYFQQPFFKPDWSPDAFLSSNYCCHFTAIRRGLLADVGVFRPGFDGAQDYDLFLRATEKARGIHHIPRVLYHWRMSAHSTSSNAAQKPAAIGNGAKALAAAIERRGLDATVEPAPTGARYRIHYPLRNRPKVSILIPTRDQVELLGRTIETLEKNTDWPAYEIVILDNDSTDPAAVRYLRASKHRVLQYEGPFNFASVCNFGVRATDGELILFLNNDTECIHADWLTAMAEHAMRPKVGAVGAKLLFPSGLVQHGGVVVSDTDVALETYFNYPADTYENGGMLQMTRNYSAVTAACMLMRRAVFDEVGGFDEVNFAVSFNDVDLCLRLRDKGYSIVYTPHAQLIHHKSASRGYNKSNPAESRHLRERWAAVLAHDPFNNPALVRRAGSFGPLER